MDETAQTRRAALRIANFCRSPMISASIPSVVESGILRLSHSTGFVGEKVRLRGRECRAPTSYLLRGHAPAPTASGAPRDLSGGQQLFQLQSSRGFVDLLDRRQLARQPVQRGLIHLALAVGLVGLIGAPMQIAHYPVNRPRIAGIELRLVLLSDTAPP